MTATKKTVAKKKSVDASSAPKKSKSVTTPRLKKKPVYSSFRLHKRIRPHQPALPNGFSLFKQSFRIFRENKRLFLGISLVYIALSVVLVKGFSSTLNIQSIRGALKDTYSGFSGGALSVVALFGVLVSSGGATNGTADASAYQTMIVILTCLATIWALRQSFAGKRVTAKNAFYKGLYPLIPFVLVMMVIALQLIPLAIGSWLYSVVITGGIAITALEKTLWILIILLFMTLSLYMAASSIFGLFVVTLPDMTPLRALRSARKLVLHRRWQVARRLLFLPLALFIVAALVMTPFLIWLAVVAEWVFFILSAAGWIFAIGYIYNLYRALLNE